MLIRLSKRPRHASATLWLPVTLIFSFMSMSSAAQARLTGTSYQLVGFSMNGKVLTRQHDAQYGVVRFEVLTLDDGREIDSRYVPSTANYLDEQSALVAEHEIVSAGFPGALSPNLGAAVVVVPDTLPNESAGRRDIWLLDGQGARIVASLPIESACNKKTSHATAELSIDWAPGGRIAAVSGHVRSEATCGAPKRVPVMVLVRSRRPNTSLDRSRLISLLAETVRDLSETSPIDTLAVIRQWLAVKPSSLPARAALARVQSNLKDSLGTQRALWSLVQQGYEGGGVASSLLLEAPIAKAIATTKAIELMTPLIPPLRRLPETDWNRTERAPVEPTMKMRRRNESGEAARGIGS